MIFTYHQDGTLPTAGEIFVFGSNLAGIHGAGAAKVAHEKFGAEWGVGKGFTGSCYALPTKDKKIHTLSHDEVAKNIRGFILQAWLADDELYWVTRVGCGLAGYLDDEIAPLFRDAPSWCNFPEPWQSFLEDNR